MQTLTKFWTKIPHKTLRDSTLKKFPLQGSYHKMNIHYFSLRNFSQRITKTGENNNNNVRSHNEVPKVWVVYRSDDNGNEFKIASFDNANDAQDLVAQLTKHQHKQHYWIEHQEKTNDESK